MLTVWCPPETRAKDVAVSYDKGIFWCMYICLCFDRPNQKMEDPADRLTTHTYPPTQTHTQDSRRLLVAVSGRPLLEGELANPVKVDEDTGLDWELVGGTGGGARRAVRVALQKVRCVARCVL